jgi:hypothetical protein
MSKLDDAIREALSKEDAEFLNRFGTEPGSFQQIFAVFRGPFAWLTAAFMVVLVPLLAFCLYAGWRFYASGDVREMLLWGAGALAALLIAIVIRIWFFLEIQTNRVVREIKRLELQLARQAAK